MTSYQRRNAIFVLATCLVLTIIMVVVGGITRLTHSGLSIVEWEPIMGIIPPLSKNAWQIAFAKYQSMPEYRYINSGMHLAEFKSIFWMEYIHRLLGRIIGLAVLIPLLYAIATKNLTKTSVKQLCLLGTLILCQGIIGWWMVKSGLKDNPFVSPLRLAIHLSLALFIIASLTWFLCGYVCPSDSVLSNMSQERMRFMHKVTVFLFALIAIQIIIGAVVAGLKGGWVYNSFPKMGKDWIPDDAFSLTPLFYNFFHNPVCVQLLHRLGGSIILVYSLFWGYEMMKTKEHLLCKWGKIVICIVFVQITLGIATLLYYVPLLLAVLHQLGGVVLVITLTRISYILSQSITKNYARSLI